MSKTIAPLLMFCATVMVCLAFIRTSAMAIRSVDFEVFGRVQGVFFRKYTQQQANNLGLKGWCKNTPQGTVQGAVQGPSDKVNEMMEWLRTKGSPSSLIDKAEFKNDKEITNYSYQKFDIVKD